MLQHSQRNPKIVLPTVSINDILYPKSILGIYEYVPELADDTWEVEACEQLRQARENTKLRIH